MADKKISELDAITGANTAATDVFVVVDTSTGQTKKITREELNNAIEQDVLDSIDIDTINGDFTVNGNINLGDNDKAIFGAGSDLQIYHDGSNSYLQDAGTGNLYIQSDGTSIRLRASDGTQMLRAEPADGSVRLYYGGSQKFITTSTGIDVTGTVTADGLTVDGTVELTDANNLYLNNSGYDGAGTHAAIRWFSTGSAKRKAADIITAAADSFARSDLLFRTQSGTGDADPTEVMRVTHDNRVGIGTSSPRDLLNLSSSTGSSIVLENSTTSLAQNAELGAIEFYTNDASNAGVGVAASIRSKVSGSTGGQAVLIFSTADSVTNDVERMRIDPSGRVGIGTSSPASLVTGGSSPVLTIGGTDTALVTGDKSGSISFITNDGSYTGTYSDGITGEIASVSESAVGGAYGLAFYTGTTTSSNRDERVRIDATGDVGIGTTSPSYQTHIKGTGSAFRLGLESDGLITGQAFITDNSGSPVYASISSGLGNLTFAADSGNSYASSYMDFQIDGSEKARLDASGNLLVGKTSTSSALTTAGVDLRPEGRSFMTRSGGPSLYLSRTTSDGNIVEFYKDGATVGSIGTFLGDLTIGDDDVGIRFDTGVGLVPWDLGATSTGGSATDNTIDIGASTARFKDLHLRGTAYVGTSISPNTSDGFDTSRLSIGGGGNATSTGRGSLVQYHGNEHASAAGAMKHFMGNVSGSYISWHLGSGTEAARLDASGNLLVGTTDTSPHNNSGATSGGIALHSDSYLSVGRSSGAAMFINRQSNDGDIIDFRKDGTTVGSIGVYVSDRLYIADASNGLQFDQTVIRPCDNTGANTDNVTQLGSSGSRFKDLYLSNSAYVKNIGGISDTDTYLNFGDVANTIKAFTGGSERMRIDSSGSVLIGATSRTDPSSASKVIIKSNFLSEWGLSMISTQTSGAAAFIRFIYNSSTAVGSISSSATNVSYNTSSDQRLKENIADANDAGNKIDAIQVRQFDWKVDGSHQDYGMIAQELQNVAPEVVSGDADSEEMMGVDYSKLVPMLIKEIQSLRNRVSKLEGN